MCAPPVGVSKTAPPSCVQVTPPSLDRSTPQYQDDTGVLSASLNYDVTRNVSLHFDALNLNDPILKYYGANRDQPRAFYANGRQYYFTVRVKL